MLMGKGIRFFVSGDTEKNMRCDGINIITPNSYCPFHKKNHEKQLKVDRFWQPR